MRSRQSGRQRFIRFDLDPVAQAWLGDTEIAGDLREERSVCATKMKRFDFETLKRE